MKQSLLITIFIFLTSCTAFIEGKIAGGYIDAYKSISNALVGYENIITEDLVNRIPYASMTLQIGKGPKGLLILESIRGDLLTWVSQDGVYIVTNKGRIVQTSGLENNLLEYNSSFSLEKNLINDKTEYSNFYSYDFPSLNNLEVKSIFTKRKTQEESLLMGIKSLAIVEERFFNDYLGWKRLNRFWLDKQNYVWKSEQYISPKMPVFILEITKKPSI